ncbi:MAG: hypothetical protein IPM64_17970 [Phycisphaerales bacterium]|nr:hypothetical protein [Phycisphaerales bacterium]
MANSRIGNLTFVELRALGGPGGGPPQLPQQLTEIEERPGVDGLSVLLIGKKGLPFQMQSGVDVDDRDAAENAIREYHDLVGSLVDVVWNGLNYTAIHNTKYAVLAPLEGVSVHRLTAAVGGVSTSKGFWVSAIWTLVPIDVTPPPE